MQVKNVKVLVLSGLASPRLGSRDIENPGLRKASPGVSISSVPPALCCYVLEVESQSMDVGCKAYYLAAVGRDRGGDGGSYAFVAMLP